MSLQLPGAVVTSLRSLLDGASLAKFPPRASVAT